MTIWMILNMSLSLWMVMDVGGLSIKNLET
jgi:hypothetical protein